MIIFHRDRVNLRQIDKTYASQDNETVSFATFVQNAIVSGHKMFSIKQSLLKSVAFDYLENDYFFKSNVHFVTKLFLLHLKRM